MKKRVKRHVEWISAAVLIVVCCGGRVYGLMPFGAAMFCALSGCTFIGFAAPVYLLCSFLFAFDVWRLYTSGAVILIASVRWLLGLKLPRFGRDVAKILFSIGAIVAESLLLGIFCPVANAAITGFVGVIFYYFARRVAVSACLGFSRRLGVTEAASVCVVLAVCGITFGRAKIDAFNIGLALAYFSTLLLNVIGVKAELAGGFFVALGLGFGLDLSTAFAFGACTATLTAFRKIARPLYALLGIGVFAASSVLLYKNPIAVGWDSLMMFCGGALFTVLPRRAVKALGEYFDFDGSARLAVRHYINRTKADAGNRMLAVASVFDETARLMNSFAEPQPDFAALGQTLSDKLCPYCADCDGCDKASASVAFAAVAERAYSGKAIITDLPEFFSSSCSRTGEVIGAAAEITNAARTSKRESAVENKAKAVITERLAAIKDVLAELGMRQAAPVGFDGAAEERIADELNVSGVECAEVFFTRDGVTAVVRTATADRETIRRAVSVCLKREYLLLSLEKTQASGWSVATLKKRPAYEAVYARAGVAKSGVSGDSYTFERIEDRFLVALLDGMGSGASASASSDAAVELIECFYKAGFDSQAVLSGVNRFLKLPTAENYSAADVVVCDLDTAAVDIIKIGAPPCYIKTADTVLKIEGSSLPIGVLDEMRPYVTTKRIYPGQMLILVTDGISDCFSGDELPEFINGLSAFNPETVSGAILRRALDICGGTPRDDMTAIAFRLYDAPKKRVRSA